MTVVHHWQAMCDGQHVVELEPGTYTLGGDAAAGATVERLVSLTPAQLETVTIQDGGGAPPFGSPRRRQVTREVRPAAQEWEAFPLNGASFTVTTPGHYRITAGRGELNLCREEEQLT